MNRPIPRAATIVAAAAACVFALAGQAQAANFPSAPIKVTNCFPAGGGVDRNVQMLKPFLEKELGVSILPEYQPGASNTLAMQQLKKAPKTGYNLAVCDNGGAILAPIALGLDLGPDDMVPVARIALSHWILVAHKDSPYQTIPEFVNALKAANDKPMSLPIANIASSDHYAWLQFLQAAGVPLKNVRWTPFGGGGPKVRALLAGETGNDLLFASLLTNHVKDGTLSPMAVMSDNAIEAFPKLPTFASFGYNVVDGISIELYAPAGTPQDAVKVLRDSMRKVKANPEFQEGYKKLGQEIHLFLPGDEFEPMWREYWRNAGPALRKAIK